MVEQKTKMIEDIYFAACLLSYGVELLSVDKRNFRHQKFNFSGNVSTLYVINSDAVECRKDVTIDEAEALFVSGKLLFPPNYPDSIRRIKSIIYSSMAS